MNTEINCDVEQEPCPVGKLLRSANPATLDFIGGVQETPPTAIREILDQARQVQHDWEQVHIKTRIKLLKNALQYIRDHIEEIAFTIASETGKPKIEAVNSDIITAIGVGDFTVHGITKVLKRYRIKMGRIGNLLRLLGRYSYIVPKPVGVVGIISPWNYPFGIPFSQVIMAVAAGNAVILKPSTETPLTGLRIQEVFDQAGFPPGLVQAIPGTGSGIGNALVESDVDRIIFTGSVDVGRQVMARAAQRLTPVTLELGGKDAMVVFDDADIDRAATAAVFGSFLNAGQTCVGVKRIYVQQAIYEQFLKHLKEKVETLKQGWGWDDPDVSIGPLINARAIGDMENQVARAVEQGARVLTGGHRNTDLPGLFFKPTVLVNVTQDMDCVRGEIFGPIVCVLPFNTETEGINLANDSEFALSGSVWTRDVKRGKRVAEKMDAGTVVVNNLVYTFGLGATPWGGKRNSGYGRTHGLFGFHELLEPHHVHVDKGRLSRDPWWQPYNAGKFQANLDLMDVAYFGKNRRIFSLVRKLSGKSKKI